MKELKNQDEDTRFSSSEHGKRVLKNFKQQLRVANQTEQTVRNYTRSIEGLMNFLNELPENLDVDQIIDFLHDLKIEKERNWRTIKIYVAGIRWYYQIPGEKFIRRFLFHIVPYRFVRIRHYGFLSTRNKKKYLQAIRKVLKAKTPLKRGKLLCRDVVLLVYGRDITICPTCKQGVLLTYGHWSKNKEPPVRCNICA